MPRIITSKHPSPPPGGLTARPIWMGKLEPEKLNAFAAIEWAVHQQRYEDVLDSAPMIARSFSLLAM